MSTGDSGSGGASAAVRVVIAVGAAATLLLLGGALGLLLATPAQDTRPDPSAVDIGFAQDMTAHHQQAVTMATLARERGADVAVRQLAFDIETNQRDQIGRMRGWLSLWGEPGSPGGPPMQWMREGGHQHGAAHGMSPGAAMPGMATTAELDRLRGLDGPAFDSYFLQLMLRHHEGGAPMARYGSEHAGLAPVRGLAANMLGSQASESELMRGMLTDRRVQPLPQG